MNPERTLAERLAALTEQAGAAPGTADGATIRPGHAGTESLERVIRAYSNLRQTDSAEPTRPVLFVWGHLEVLQELGSGSYGKVFRAFDKVLEREVALKLRSSDETTARAYIVEARRLASVRHPHVLAVHGAAVHEGRAGLWADLIEGCTLSDWVAAEGPRSGSEVLASATMLAAALEAVHKAGLIHGDVKPGNIMRDRTGDLVLMDFGTAIENDSNGVRISIGSPLAMAPEQLRGARVSSAIDIYAMGVVLYFLASGRYPLTADSIQALSDAHASGKRPDFVDLSQRCGRGLSDHVARMMAANPTQRPDAGETLRALHAIALAPARRRKRIAVVSVVAALAIALVVSLVALIRIDAERKSAILANQRESSVRDFMREFLRSPKPGAGGADARVIDVLTDAVPVAEKRFAAEPLALADVIGDIGFSFAGIGAYAQATPLLERALNVGRQNGMSDEKLLPLEIRLAASNAYVAGAKARTEPLQALFERSRDLLGAAHVTTLQAALELAMLQNTRSEREVSEANFRYVLAQRPAAVFPANSQRLLAQVQLVSIMGEQQRWTEADPMLREALLATRLAGMENGSLGIMLRLAEATMASRRGKFAEAETLTRSLLSDIEKTYGPRHRNVRATLNDLAVSQRMQGKTDEAIVSLRRTLDLAQSQLGDDHYEVLSIRDNLASALADAGNRQAALELREGILDSKTRTHGEKHPGTLISAINLAEQYVEDGDAKRGRELAAKAARNAQAVFGSDHLFTLEAREIGARAQLELGESGPARLELAAVHIAKQRVLGDDDVYTLRSAGFLAHALSASGDRAAALALLGPAIESLQKQFGDDQPDLRRMRKQAASITGPIDLAPEAKDHSG